MSYDRIRLYDAGRFHDTELPEWYRGAERLSETERVDFHRAFDRVLDCEHTLLTEEGMLCGALEIRFGDLDGVEFVARIDIGTDTNGEDKNEIRAAVTPDHRDYAALTRRATPAPASSPCAGRMPATGSTSMAIRAAARSAPSKKRPDLMAAP